MGGWIIQTRIVLSKKLSGSIAVSAKKKQNDKVKKKKKKKKKKVRKKREKITLNWH